jgi:PAS domain S-box-containing protein
LQAFISLYCCNFQPDVVRCVQGCPVGDLHDAFCNQGRCFQDTVNGVAGLREKMPFHALTSTAANTKKGFWHHSGLRPAREIPEGKARRVDDPRVAFRVPKTRKRGATPNLCERTFSKWLAMVWLFSAVLLSAFAPSCRSQEIRLTPQEQEWLQEHRYTLRLTPDPAYPPLEFFDAEGVYRGMSADYIALIEKRLGIVFRVQRTESWDKALEDIRNKRTDLLLSTQKTPERSKYLLFTPPWIEVPTVIVTTRKNRKLDRIALLRDRKVAVVKGHGIIEQFLARETPWLEPEPVKDAAEGLLQTAAGEVDAMLVQLPVAAYTIEKLGIVNLTISGTTAHKYDLAFASRRDLPILNDILVKGLASITPEEKKAIRDRWIHLELEPYYKNEIFQAIAFSVLLFFFLVVLWGLSLKREVRQRKSFESRLRASERKFRNVVKRSPMGMFLYRLDHEGRLILMESNCEADNILGIDTSRFLGKTIEEAFPLLAETEVPERFRHLCTNGGHWHNEQIDYRGGKIQGAFEFQSFQTAPGEMAVMFADITERKRTERLLKERELLYRSLFEENVSVMLLVDPDAGVIVDANPAACRYYGYTREQMRSLAITDINTLSAAEVQEELQKVREEKRSFFHFHHRLSDGSVRPVEVFAGPIELEGRPLVCSVVHDIRDRKQAEEEREKLIDELLKLLAEVKTLSGLLPICARCKKVRDDSGYWKQIEIYLKDHSDAEFSHGLCPECVETMYGDQKWYRRKHKKEP